MIYALLFYEFFKIGLFAIGGGAVTIPFLFDLTEKYDWFTTAQLTNMIAVAESTPGPLGVNMATFAGFQSAGIFRRNYRHFRTGASFCRHHYLDFKIIKTIFVQSACANPACLYKTGGFGADNLCRLANCPHQHC